MILNTRFDYYQNEKAISDYIKAPPGEDSLQSVSSWQLIQVGDEMALMKLMVGIPSAMVPIQYEVLIPESNILIDIPFFRVVIYIIPLGGLLILVF